MTRAERIRQLVAELDRENTNDAEEAQFELTEEFGAEALGPLLEAAPGFSDFGRLCARQVVMYFMYWTRRPEYDPTTWYGITEAGATVELDWGQPWGDLVGESRRQAIAKVEEEAPTIPPTTVVTIEWIDRSDIQTSDAAHFAFRPSGRHSLAHGLRVRVQRPRV